jgi:hypothetical protein
VSAATTATSATTAVRECSHFMVNLLPLLAKFAAMLRFYHWRESVSRGNALFETREHY